MRGAAAAAAGLVTAAALAWGLGARAPAHSQPLDTFGHTMSSSTVTCHQCHEDDEPHRGTASAACEDCHTTTTWYPSTFTLLQHSQTRFPLSGAHERLSNACRDDQGDELEGTCCSCHVPGAPRSNRAARPRTAGTGSARFVQLIGLPTDCVGCHISGHRTEIMQTQCASCHQDAAWAVEDFDHALTGFAIDGPHADLRSTPGNRQCDTCHEGMIGAKVSGFRQEHPNEAVSCGTCHEASHADFPGNCTDCHQGDRGFADAVFDHRSTGWPLERRHAAVSCAGCHPPGADISVTSPTSTCTDCHRDPHAGQAGPTCTDCHATDRWRMVRFDHDFAAWPLRGRHALVACLDCHTNQRWVGLGSECWDCHMLDAARAPDVPDSDHSFGQPECSNCHPSQWTWRLTR